MVDLLYNLSTAATVATAHAPTPTSSAVDVTNVFSRTGDLGVIIILSALVVAGILFFICGLLLKAEAHLQVEREMFQGGLLADSIHLGIDE